jgi:hypothetical protein
MNGLEVERMREHELDGVLLAEIGKPVPAEDALGGDDQVVHAGLDSREKGRGLAGQRLVEQGGAAVIGQAEVHGSRVQVNATVVTVIAAIESHEVPPGSVDGSVRT